MSYNILSIDGGGIRGIVPLAIIENLDRAAPGWRNNINMFAGTSTGGLIALALAKGMQPRDIMDVYLNRGSFIFERSLWQEVKSIGEVTGAKYAGTNRETVCRDILGNDRLSDFLTPLPATATTPALGPRHVVVCAFDLDDQLATDPAQKRWSAKIFHNMPTVVPPPPAAPIPSDDGGEIAYRVAMRTSAAPTYFPSYDGYVDGGVYANNPAMCALAQTQDTRLVTPIAIGDVKMLSLGTGYAPNHVSGEENWGLAEWSTRLVDLLMDGVNEVADFQVKQLIGSRYQRLSPALGQSIDVDDSSMSGRLQQIGNGVDVSGAVPLVLHW